jgi:hypothetical protein
VVAAGTGSYYGRHMTAGSVADLVSGASNAIVRATLWRTEAIGIVPGRGFVILDGGRARLVTAKP